MSITGIAQGFRFAFQRQSSSNNLSWNEGGTASYLKGKFDNNSKSKQETLDTFERKDRSKTEEECFVC